MTTNIIMNRFVNILPASLPVLLGAVILCAAGIGSAETAVVDNRASAYLAGDTLNAPGLGTAQAFTTGNEELILTSVQINLEVFAYSEIEVKLWSGSGTKPATVVENLGTLGFAGGGGSRTFPSTERPTLSANTRYWISVVCVSGDFDWTITASGTNLAGNGTIDNLTSLTSNSGSSWGGSGGDFRRFAVFGAVPGELDDSFTPPALSGPVRSLLPIAGGKMLVGGEFANVEGDMSRDHIFRLDEAGVLDTSFNVNGALNSFVDCLAEQEDGKILAGGALFDVGGNTDLDRIIRLEENGTLDTTFTPPAGLNSSVLCIVPQKEGKILVGGIFSDVGGNSNLDRIIRLNANGTLDNTFVPPANLPGVVHSILPLPNGKLLIGGSFSEVSGNGAFSKLAVLFEDGGLDSSFQLPTPLSGNVDTMVQQADGKILVGGFFVNVNGNPGVDRIFRLNVDLTLDTSFSPPVGLSSWVRNIVPQADGKILIAGEFNDVDGDTDLDKLIRLNEDGSLDTSFVPPAGLSSTVQALASQDGKLYIGGVFQDAGGDTDQDYLARLENSGGSRTLSVPNLQTIRWEFSGAEPVAHRVFFEASTDGGTTFTPLGEGTRVANGFEYKGTNIPAVSTILARAILRDYGGNGSVDEIEDTLAISKTAKPTLKLKGKKKIVTSRGRINIRGLAIDPDGDVRMVRFKDSRPKGKRYRNAKGTTNWKAKAKLKPGRNKILVQAIDSRGVGSALLKVTVIQK